MASHEGCVAVTWEIRNFSVLLKAKEGRTLSSPVWKVEDTEERLLGRLNANHYDSQIEFYEYGFGSHRFRFEMSFISSYGEVLLEKNFSRTLFNLPKSALFDKNRQSIVPNDTITLCCRMWRKILKTSEFKFITVLHSLNHLWTIEKLASSDSHDTYIGQENFQLHVSLKKNRYGDWMVIVERERYAPGDLSIVDCVLIVKDCCGPELNFQRNLSSLIKYLFYISRSSNITGVTLQLELIVALHAQLKPNSSTNIAKHKNVSSALGDELLLLYRESTLSDATLNTAGKSFSAHRSILAARSPVFRDMFEKYETTEGQSGVVDIDDVDSGTVDRMLVYLYGDSVGDLSWKEASTLYYAADKYALLPLKEKCADFLKVGLAADNACHALVLAVRHKDQELMTCVVDFIHDHEEVVFSAQWRELETGNPLLCAKIATQLFLKKGRKKMRV